MTDRIASLPDDERCCAASLRDHGVPGVMHAFAQHCVRHGLEADRYATLWTWEMLVQAALSFQMAAREQGRADLGTIENFEIAAKTAWREAAERRRTAQ